jgi:tetratricopeptide (TPR) repeat protein
MQAQVPYAGMKQAKATCAKLIQAAGASVGLRAIAFAAITAGSIATPGFVHAATTGAFVQGGQDRISKKAEKQVSAAERAVTKAPQDAASRARLAQSYLAAGRFMSASASFEDAVSLGDKSPSTALGMALSYIAVGRNGEAAALLGQWGDTIPASDHGLALALAGQPAQAIALLGNAIKAGENTPKMRQNLAYAYALSGHLPEARVIASQDVPADKLDVRVSEWALQASVGSQQSRVAALLGTPVRSDPGRPARLALATTSAQPLLAVAEPAPQPPAPDELPALAAPAFAQAQTEPQPEAVAPTPEEQRAAVALASYEAPAVRQPVRERRVVATPAVERVAARVASRRSSVSATADERKPAAPKRPVGGTHVVQLGSFTTEAGARRAWGIFVGRDRSLKDRELRITEAMVNGRRYFRVAAAGYEANEAHNKCSSIKGRGNECLAYADARANSPAFAAKSVARRLASR